MERFQNSSIQIEKQKIDQLLKTEKNEIFKKNTEGEEKYANYIETKLTNINTDNIFDLYDQLYQCVISKLCDKQVSIKFYEKYANDIVGTFYPYIKNKKNRRQRLRTSNYIFL